MTESAAALFASHVILAITMFFLVNWIGNHAVDFGYASTTLFEAPNESVALNFFIRAMSPAVFIIGLAVIAVAIGQPALRLQLYWVAVYYYVFRGGAIFFLNRQRLVSWLGFFGHALVGTSAAMVAYSYLIVPNRSLMPNLEEAGNELWLAILVFLYAVANKVPLSGGPGARRRNNFIRLHYEQAVRKFGAIINGKIQDDLLKLIAFSVLVYEDYARPPAIREFERLMFWKRQRTTGVMQVSGDSAYSDEESVAKGADILVAAWNKRPSDPEDVSSRVWRTIGEYNADTDYISKVMEVMEIIAKRVDSTFKPAYATIYGE